MSRMGFSSWRAAALGRPLALACLAALVLSAPFTPAAETLPPAPKAYFNDYAGVVSSETASRLNRTLEDFERAASSQIVVAVFRKLPPNSAIEDYTFRVAEAWKVGQQGKDNGAVLFVFIDDRKMFIQVGYGLEGALPDAVAKRIIDEEIAPRFRDRDFDGGLTAGVQAMLAATRGEYQGSGRTVAQNTGRRGSGDSPIPVIVVFVVILLLAALFGRRGYRRRYSPWGGWTVGHGGWSSHHHHSSGWGGWGGGSSGGGGGFSGGGGRFGGGGAGGGW